MDYARLSFWSFGNWNSLFLSNEQRIGFDGLIILLFYFFIWIFFSCVWSELFGLLPFLNSYFTSILHYFEIWISNFFFLSVSLWFLCRCAIAFLSAFPVSMYYLQAEFSSKLHILLWLILNSFWFLFLSPKFGVTE